MGDVHMFIHAYAIYTDQNSTTVLLLCMDQYISRVHQKIKVSSLIIVDVIAQFLYGFFHSQL